MAPSDHWQDIGPTYCVLRFHKPSRDVSGAACAASSKLRPSLRFLARVLGAYVLDIVICEIAVLKRHCNPVHARSGAFFAPAVGAAMLAAAAAMKARRPSAVISTSLVYWSSAAAKPRCATTSPTEHPNASPLSELCKLFPILQGQLASFTLFALVWDMPLLRPDSAEGLERRMTIALRNGRARLPGDGHVRVGSSGKISLRAYRVRFIPVNGSGSRHSDRQLNGIIGLMCRSKVAR